MKPPFSDDRAADAARLFAAYAHQLGYKFRVKQILSHHAMGDALMRQYLFDTELAQCNLLIYGTGR